MNKDECFGWLDRVIVSGKFSKFSIKVKNIEIMFDELNCRFRVII